jgi:hypothetical protein
MVAGARNCTAQPSCRYLARAPLSSTPFHFATCAATSGFAISAAASPWIVTWVIPSPWPPFVPGPASEAHAAGEGDQLEVAVVRDGHAYRHLVVGGVEGAQEDA